MENIVDQRLRKKTRRKTYFEYFFKWKGQRIEDSSWESEEDIQRHGEIVQEFMDRSSRIFQPEEYDARASPTSQ